jgi:hypothetical protein
VDNALKAIQRFTLENATSLHIFALIIPANINFSRDYFLTKNL